MRTDVVPKSALATGAGERDPLRIEARIRGRPAPARTRRTDGRVRASQSGQAAFDLVLAAGLVAAFIAVTVQLVRIQAIQVGHAVEARDFAIGEAHRAPERSGHWIHARPQRAHDAPVAPLREVFPHGLDGPSARDLWIYSGSGAER